ncbi:MAG: DNA alkylation repair protein [Bryobacteraceae bacterium]|nr:DNA alkylation repair protein [Bryobacteraceae bacterium]
MTVDEVMKTLERLGSEQTRKTYRRHGCGPDVFGVSFADLEVLKKKIKTDHALALELWRTHNVDARHLAPMVADAEAMTEDEFEEWVNGIDYYGYAMIVARLAAASPAGKKRMKAWLKARNDYVGETGWTLLAARAGKDAELTDEECEEYLEAIEKRIHKAGNWTRYAMNGALIAIGGRAGLREKALEAARRIGKVEVDHGETNCKTPDAATYIGKMAAREAAKAK